MPTWMAHRPADRGGFRQLHANSAMCTFPRQIEFAWSWTICPPTRPARCIKPPHLAKREGWGNAPPLKDPITGLVFPDLNSPPLGGEDFQTNLIMPEPCPFLTNLNSKFPVCSIIRPVSTDLSIFGAVAAITGLAKSGLFIGQPAAFFTAAYLIADQDVQLGKMRGDWRDRCKLRHAGAR
jgi:hypothetical protein